MATILVVEDDRDLWAVLAFTLSQAGHVVALAATAQQALERWESEQPALVVLDLGLPNHDGLEVCRRIKAQVRTPVLILTGRDAEEDVVGGLRAGADDYLTKPFSSSVLLARVEALLRRYEHLPRETAPALGVEDLVLEAERRAVTVAGARLALSPTEFRLLHALVLNVGHVVSLARLAEAAWGADEPRRRGQIKSHISHLRRKLARAGQGRWIIQAVAGAGYVLERV